MTNPENNPNFKGEEKRRFRRIAKHFIMTYSIKGEPDDQFEITQLKNISLGGMCFITTQAFASSTILGIHLRTPYLTEATYFEGVVLESNPKIKGLLYETRLEFKTLAPDAEFLLKKINEVFLNGNL